jgi:hypothetical protein
MLRFACWRLPKAVNAAAYEIRAGGDVVPRGL